VHHCKLTAKEGKGISMMHTLYILQGTIQAEATFIACLKDDTDKLSPIDIFKLKLTADAPCYVHDRE